MREYGLFIDGKFVSSASGQTGVSTDPSSGEQIAVVPRANARDARRAVEAARRSFDDGAWRHSSSEQRREALLSVCDALWQRVDEIADLETRDAGMTIHVASGAVSGAIEQARALVRTATSIPAVEQVRAATPARGQGMLVRDPYGVCVAITPATAPFASGVRKVFAALAMGNSVVLKPSPLTPCTSTELAIAFAASDVPPGVFNVVTGGDAAAGEELVGNPLVDLVSFTGSTDVGRRVAQLASSTPKPVVLVCSGNNANILLEDADLDLAIPGALAAAFAHQGQTCLAGSRLFAHRSIYDQVVDRLVTGATQLRIGPTTSWETDLGPLVSQTRLERIERHVRSGREECAELVCGGRRLTDDGLDRGYYFAPAIFARARADMRIAHDPPGGPVLAVIPYDRIEEAISASNSTVYGLAAGVWGRDRARAVTAAMRLEAGTVWVNDWNTVAGDAPFGGYKRSGIGKELGAEGCLSYTQTKHVSVGPPEDGAAARLPSLQTERP